MALPILRPEEIHNASPTATGTTGGAVILGGIRKRKSTRGKRTLRKKSRKNRSKRRR
jgi:hypothetical protein